ncbi:MAG: glutamate racemase [Chitinophagales bacterium]|nr:MAG: glutamate racemase [Chitinophagales bacterium]
MLTLSANAPIGIFDSGIGGLTIAETVVRHLPHERIIYFGDTAHLPYGEKSEALICHYAEGITRLLIEKGCKLIIIACNSASAAAYAHLVNRFGTQVHFINVIDPVIQGISAMRDVAHVGIIGTQRTIRSGIYTRRLRALRSDLRTSALETPLLAPMIEAGFFNNQISEVVICTYLADKQLQGIDTLILACTHYPLIRPVIHRLCGDSIRVFDSTDFIGEEVGTVLAKNGLLSQKKTEKNKFYVSDLTESFEKTTRFFFREEIELELYPLWD